VTAEAAVVAVAEHVVDEAEQAEAEAREQHECARRVLTGFGADPERAECRTARFDREHREDRGFRGHLRALASGRVTTGICKIIGGVAVAFVLASQDDFVTGKRLLSDAVLIALAANLGNLLDRAPGRVIKCGLVAWVPLALLAGTDAVGVAIAPVMGAFAGLLGDDTRERLMIGDTGANVIGAVLGLACVLEVGRGPRNVILVALIALNLAAEFVSFSRVIDRVPALRAFDALGRRT